CRFTASVASNQPPVAAFRRILCPPAGSLALVHRPRPDAGFINRFPVVAFSNRRRLSFPGVARREAHLTMASVLLLRGVGGDAEDRHPLDPADEEALASAYRELVAFATSGEEGAIAHERDGEVVAAWSPG